MTAATDVVVAPNSLASAAEITAVREILQAGGLLGESVRIAYLGLLDPPRGAAETNRRFRAFLHDVSGAAPKDAVVSVTRGTMESVVELDTAATGELPVLEEEFEVVESILASHPEWLKALKARNLDVAQVRVAPLSAGVFEYPEEKGRRILRGLAFVQDFPEDSPWAHPVDGLVAYVDVDQQDRRCRTGLRRGPRPGRARQLHGPRADRPASSDAAAHQHHPARGSQLHCHRRQPRGVGEVEPGRRLRRPRRRGPAQSRVRRRRPPPLHHQPGVDRRNGRPLRRPLPGAVLAKLLRHRRIPAWASTPIRWSWAATASAKSRT